MVNFRLVTDFAELRGVFRDGLICDVLDIGETEGGGISWTKTSVRILGTVGFGWGILFRNLRGRGRISTSRPKGFALIGNDAADFAERNEENGLLVADPL